MRPPGTVPCAEHDVAVDLVVTPTRVIHVRRRGGRPAPRLRWDELTEEKIASIPLLASLWARDGRR